MGSIISSCWDLVERLSSSGNLYSFLLLWPGNQWVKIFVRFLSFTGLYCLNSHAPVEVGILLIFCIRDTDTYPIFVSIFIIFNYGHNSETLWGHCYELSNFLMVQICLETSLDESHGTIMYIGCRYNYIRSWTLKGPMTYILQSYYNGSVPFVWSYFIYWLDCCHVWLQFALLMSSLWACFGVNINLHFFSISNWFWCVMRTGKVILEAAILTAVVVVSLTAYTFWAAKRGHDFNFLGPFLFAALMVLMVFSLIQVGLLCLDCHKALFIVLFFWEYEWII